ncbi:MAG: SDR family oxidoreductase, partial [Gordonia amarae]
LGGPDIVVNAAGFGDAAPAIDLPVEDFRRTIDVDLTATFAVAQAAAQKMTGGGAIINIASVLGLGASWPVAQAAYCAAKGGVINLTRQLGAEWASLDIRVNAIAPGWFPTEITEEMFADERSAAYLRRNTPMRRTGRLEELDGALLLFASPSSTFITGQVLAVDGGWTA